MWCRSRKRAFSVLWGQQNRGPRVCLTPCFCLVVQCVSGGQGTPVDLPHHPAYDGSGHVPLWPVPLSSGVSAGRGTGDGCGGSPGRPTSARGPFDMRRFKDISCVWLPGESHVSSRGRSAYLYDVYCAWCIPVARCVRAFGHASGRMTTCHVMRCGEAPFMPSRRAARRARTPCASPERIVRAGEVGYMWR